MAFTDATLPHGLTLGAGVDACSAIGAFVLVVGVDSSVDRLLLLASCLDDVDDEDEDEDDDGEDEMMFAGATAPLAVVDCGFVVAELVPDVLLLLLLAGRERLLRLRRRPLIFAPVGLDEVESLRNCFLVDREPTSSHSPACSSSSSTAANSSSLVLAFRLCSSLLISPDGVVGVCVVAKSPLPPTITTELVSNSVVIFLLCCCCCLISSYDLCICFFIIN